MQFRWMLAVFLAGMLSGALGCCLIRQPSGLAAPCGNPAMRLEMLRHELDLTADQAVEVANLLRRTDELVAMIHGGMVDRLAELADGQCTRLLALLRPEQRQRCHVYFDDLPPEGSVHLFR